MGKIYSGIQGLKLPDYGKFLKTCKAKDPYREYEKIEERYVESIIASAKAAAKCPEAGEEVHFPQGDGYARYVILNLKPVELIHLAVGDAWHFPYIERLTAEDIRKRMTNDKAIRKLFTKNRK